MSIIAHQDTSQRRGREVAEKMKKRNVLVGVAGERRFRLVTHYWIDDAGVEWTVKAFNEVL